MTLPPDKEALLRSEHAPLGSLATVMTWAHGQQPALRILEIVTQDEFCHDVTVGVWRGPYLVYDTT